MVVLRDGGGQERGRKMRFGKISGSKIIIKLKKNPAGFGFQKEHPFCCSYRDPMDIWRMWSEESVPKIIFHSSKAISGSSYPPNSAPQDNSPPSQLQLSSHVITLNLGQERGETNPKPTQDLARRGLGEPFPAPEG